MCRNETCCPVYKKYLGTLNLRTTKLQNREVGKNLDVIWAKKSIDNKESYIAEVGEHYNITLHHIELYTRQSKYWLKIDSEDTYTCLKIFLHISKKTFSIFKILEP